MKRDHNIAQSFGNNERNWLAFGVSFNVVAQKGRILAIFYRKINYGEITWKLLGYKTGFKN